MPPDDPLFTQPTPETPTPTTPVDVGALVDERLAPVVQGMQQITSVFKDLQDRAASAPQPQPQAPKADDWQERFFADTRGAIDERISQATAPVVAASAATVGGMVLDSERTRVDAKYGEGAWDKHIWPELKPVYTRVLETDPARLHNREAITNAVKTIIGSNDEVFFNLRAETQKARAEAATKTEDELVTKVSSKIPSNLTGGLRSSRGGEPKLTPEHQSHLADIARETGTTITSADEGRIAALMGIKGPVGTTYADWEAANTKLAAKGAK
jgi:hypothetical protein